MRRYSLFLTVVLSLISIEAFGATTVKSGAVCTKLNQVQIVKNVKYTCLKSGKKLAWVATNTAVKSTPTATPSPQPVATPTPSPTPITTPTPATTPSATPAPIQTPDPVLAIGPTIAPPTGEITIFTGPAPVANKNVKQSFEVKIPLVSAKSTSNFKLWIYDPENSDLQLGSPGVFFQKDGGTWYAINTDRSDGGFDTKLDSGKYLIDIIEPNGNMTKYSRGRYTVIVDSNNAVSIEGLKPNSSGYFTVTAILKNSPIKSKPTFVPTTKCQLLDKTGSTSMSNGFPRAEGRLPNRGVVRALIIPVEFSDLIGTGSPATVYKEMAKGTADFYYKESQHSVRFEFTTLPKYLNLNVPVSSFKLGTYNGGDPYSYFMAGLKAAENLIDISNFDIAYVLPPSQVTYQQIAYGPAFPAELNSENYQNSTGRVLNGVVGGADAWQSLPGAQWKWMAHETGHTFGLYDWYTLDGTNPYGPWDIMSLNWSTEAIELNSWNRYISGWLADSQNSCLDASEVTSNSQVFKIEAIGVDSNKNKSVMIRLSDTRIIVVEARATAGLDVLKPNQSGVLVYTVDTSIPTIKGMANTYSRTGVSSDLRDAPLKTGETVTINGIKITATSASGTDFEVSISK